MNRTDMPSLVKKALDGESLALARLITLIENEPDVVLDLMKMVYGRTGRAYRIGVTGSPGVGKSTLVDKLVATIRKQNLRVAIIAVDPSSPFTGGAVLGDRIRMQQHYTDKGVFIRSMATRGALGGLPVTIDEVLNVIDAAGWDVILVETVGVGQNEIDVVKNVDTVMVVMAPESGDSIQTMKAGLLEIADMLVVNKADLPGADSLMAELDMMLKAGKTEERRMVSIMPVQAVNNLGVSELWDSAQEYFGKQQQTGALAEKRGRQRWQLCVNMVSHKLTDTLVRTVAGNPKLNGYKRRVNTGKMDPYTAAERLMKSPELHAQLSAGLLLRRRCRVRNDNKHV